MESLQLVLYIRRHFCYTQFTNTQLISSQSSLYQLGKWLERFDNNQLLVNIWDLLLSILLKQNDAVLYPLILF